jgi:hypothetical protein
MHLLVFLACTGSESPPPSESGPTESRPALDSDPSSGESDLQSFAVTVLVTLDGEPVQGAVVSQGGRARRWSSGADGRVELEIDPTVSGDLAVVAAHPEARTWFTRVDAQDAGAVLSLELTRFDASDNAAYVYRDPGEPERRETTSQCAHCHVTLNEDWFASPHATSATNPAVQSAYALVTSETEGTGQCADCHAPGIEGELGGHGLDEAQDLALAYGVHCDTCHRVESVDLDDPRPGVAGKLKVLRPSEDGGVGFDNQPLQFGPYDDVPNIAMGAVQRDHFANGQVCAGCHEHEQESLVGAALDAERWPEGRLPIHSTWSEWAQGPLAEAAPCQSCHMPADPRVGNSADLGNEFDLTPGVVAGWERAPGSVRRHTWYGPRQRDSGMLELAAGLFLEASIAQDQLSVQVRTRNAGPGHAIPTGEPSRNILLVVRAWCGETELAPSGGDVVPDYGGTLDLKEAGEDWLSWPGAELGQQLVVLSVEGWRDYDGPLDFAQDGRFTPEERGLAQESLVARRTITGLDGDTVTLDGPLPEGDRVLRVAPSWPVDEAAASTLAGTPGFGFARVLADSEGQRMVPHHRAVDVVSDNRIPPTQEVQTSHRFTTTCSDPVVEAALIHRAFSPALAEELGVSLTDSVMQTSRLEVGP